MKNRVVIWMKDHPLRVLALLLLIAVVARPENARGFIDGLMRGGGLR